MATVRLPDVPRALKARGYSTVPNYLAIYKAVLDGRLAADRLPNGRYQVDTDEAAKVFGLTDERVAA